MTKINRNARGWDSSIKGQILTEWIETYDPTICSHKRHTCDPKTQTSWNWRDGGKRYSKQTTTKRQQGKTLLMLEKIVYKSKMVIRDEGHYVPIQGSAQQESITVINIHTSDEEQTYEAESHGSKWSSSTVIGTLMPHSQ